VSGETSNGTFGSQALVCKSADFPKAEATFMKMMRDMMASGTPTSAQVHAAYQKAFGDMELLGQHN
jgi:hypothetical protein